MRCKGAEVSHLDAGVQEHYVHQAAQPGVPEHFAVDPAGDSEVRERASFDIRALRSRGTGPRSSTGAADPRPRRGY